MPSVYFDNRNLGHPLLVLAIWSLASITVLVIVDLLHQAERRNRPHAAMQIYATPGVAHLARAASHRHLAMTTTGRH